ncbi:MAG: flagellar basal body-associated protein FliL [Candidatus Latescibacterota bacterium]
MNRIVIIIIAIFVIVGAGGAVWYFFMQADAPIEDQTGENKSALEVSEFIDIENLSIPVIREGRVDRYIMISVSLEMRDQDSKALGDEAFPRLKDAVFSQLYSYFSMQQSSESGINVGQVKARLLWAAERAIGKGHVRQVIIQGAYERKGGAN